MVKGAFLTILTIVLTGALAVTGCDKIIEMPTLDKDPPAVVRLLKADAGDKQVVLTWANPTDDDVLPTMNLPKKG
jgi:hypothetical protein